MRTAVSVLVAVAVVITACSSGGTAADTTAGNGAVTTAISPTTVAPTTATTQTEATTAEASLPDPCSLVTDEQVATATGKTVEESGAPLEGFTIGVDSAVACHWGLGGIDGADLWLFPAGDADLKSTMAAMWAEGYEVQPLSGVGDEAYQVVWEGDPAQFDVGKVAQVGAVSGGMAAIFTLTIIPGPTDAGPAVQLLKSALSG
jgi:hypothetical protein